MAHEFGHNNAHHHAATDPDNDGAINLQYGDRSDLMGYCCSQRKFNAPHVDQIGWLDPWSSQAVVDVAADVTNYTIGYLGADPDTNTLPQIVRIDRPITCDKYYLSFRRLIDLDANMYSSYGYHLGVNIYHASETGIWSYHVTNLKDGESFVDSANGIVVSQVSSTESTVNVDITFDTCARSAPTVSISPSSFMTTANIAKDYDVQVTSNVSGDCETATYNLVANGGGANASLSVTQLDLAPGGASASVLTASTSVDGLFTLTVTATGDGPSGNDTATYEVDANAPTPPGALAFSTQKHKRVRYVKLSWGPSDDGNGTGVDHYVVKRDGVEVGTTSSLSYLDMGAPSDGTYDYAVTAVDGANHPSGSTMGTYSPGAGDGGDGGGGKSNKGGGKGKPPKAS